MSTMQGGSGGTIIQEFLAADTYIIRGTQYTHTYRDMPHAAQAASFLTQFWVPLFHIGSRLHACSSARCATRRGSEFLPTTYTYPSFAAAAAAVQCC